jgi:glycosyltransferase involved in cell wall biosynthesis
VIIGEGSARERSTLANLAAQLGIVGDVAFPGESDVVAAWLRRADLFVSSSLWEGSAGALVEALAIGCPVVATSSVGSARDLLEDGRIGRLVPPRDPRRLARAMIEELGTRRDRDLLEATVAPYASKGRAADYLAAIDGCVANVAAYMDGK